MSTTSKLGAQSSDELQTARAASDDDDLGLPGAGAWSMLHFSAPDPERDRA
ncbi:MAG TPA: hypothetical protein VG960_12000 [Caulobacteraceae bacterium]|nr:hypothetical protein [Caulobacteraceae bacterium]